MSPVADALPKTEAHNVLLKGTTPHPLARGTSRTGYGDISVGLEGTVRSGFSDDGNKLSFGSPPTKRKAFSHTFYS